MRKISFADISIFIVNYIFNWRFRIAKLTKQSKIIRKIIDKGLFEDDDVTVIPNTIKINKTIEAEKSEFIPTDILKEVIEKIDDIVIMNSCLCRTSNNCKDYPQDIGCIFRNKIDSIWMNVKPKEGLLTICHCCPCCCLWKVIPQLDDKISDKMHKLDGVEIAIDNSKCIDCMKCLNEICMSEAISFKDNAIQINQNKCRGCGLCVNICKQNAITLKYNDKSIDSIVNKLHNLVEL